MSVAAIILAAGGSRRLGQPKQLVNFRGETLLAHAIRLAHEGGAGPVLAVLGANFEAIVSSLPADGCVVVQNDKWEQGIASSIHAGLGALEVIAPHAEGTILMSCDQPRLRPEHICSLIEAFERSREAAIITSQYAETDGVPAIFPRSVFMHLQALGGDQGARSLIRNPPCTVVSIAFPDGDIDIDTPEDLAQLL